MKLPFPINPGLPAGVGKALLDLQARLEATESWAARIVDTPENLPKAADWQGRSVIVRDIDGMGAKGWATALDGVWYDESWSAL